MGLMPSARQVASHAERSKASSLVLQYFGDGVQTGIGDIAGDIASSASSRHNGSSGQNFTADAGTDGGSAMAAVDGGGAVPHRPVLPQVVESPTIFIGAGSGLPGQRARGGNERQRAVTTSATGELCPK